MVIDTYKADVNLKLVVEIQQGNQKSLGALFEKYAPALSGIINKITNNAALNENILKKSFVNAWNKIHSFIPANCSFFTWLINITRQTAFEEIRIEEKQNSIYNNTVYIAQKNDSQHLTPFDLVYYRGLNYVETAAVLQTSVESEKEDIRKTMVSLKPRHLKNDE